MYIPNVSTIAVSIMKWYRYVMIDDRYPSDRYSTHQIHTNIVVASTVPTFLYLILYYICMNSDYLCFVLRNRVILQKKWVRFLVCSAYYYCVPFAFDTMHQSFSLGKDALLVFSFFCLRLRDEANERLSYCSSNVCGKRTNRK